MHTSTHSHVHIAAYTRAPHAPGPWNPSAQHAAGPAHRYLPSLCTQTALFPGAALSWGFLFQKPHLRAQRQVGSGKESREGFQLEPP